MFFGLLLIVLLLLWSLRIICFVTGCWLWSSSHDQEGEDSQRHQRCTSSRMYGRRRCFGEEGAKRIQHTRGRENHVDRIP
jgi:hypothetical protein